MLNFERLICIFNKVPRFAKMLLSDKELMIINWFCSHGLISDKLLMFGYGFIAGKLIVDNYIFFKTFR